MLPNFLIIGAPRAGTTWLAKNLREHPQVFMPKTKEIHYFDRHYSEGVEYYKQFFSGADGFEAVGEATPEYMYLPEMPELIHKLMPDCKLILILRNPVDRVYSRYWNSRAKYKENKNLSFEEKIKKKPLFIEEGFYFDHLNNYYKYFKPEQFLILKYDDVLDQPLKLLQDVFLFLNVDINFKTSLVMNRVNAASDKPNLAKSKLVYYVLKILGKAGLKDLSLAIAKRNAAELPPMNPETRKWLAGEVYKEKNRQLQKLTGLDVSHWC